MTFILKFLAEVCSVVVGRLLRRRKALAVMPLDDGCFRDPKLRTPAIKAATARPSGRLSSRSKTKRGQIFTMRKLKGQE